MAPTPAAPFVASLGGSIWGSSVDPGGKCRDLMVMHGGIAFTAAGVLVASGRK